MSFALTQKQLLDGSKTVTRRLGWTQARAGQQLKAVAKGQGLKKGEKVQVLCVIRIVSVRREPLNLMLGGIYGVEEVVREGFSGITPEAFVTLFCEANRPCKPDWTVTRIEFEKVQP